MKKLGLIVLIIQGLNVQALSPCDVNQDGAINIADVQMMVNEALGTSACTSNLDGAGTCDIADVQRVITAALGGACNAAGGTPTSTIQLPVELIGLDGTTKTVSFNIPSGSNLSGTMRLSLQIHGLRYETQASVKVNNSTWLPINSATVTLQGVASQYGGIGGGFSTLSMTMNLPPGTMVSGANTMTFKFNGTDGRVSGFRVLALNVLASTGTALLPPSTFVWEDPDTWTPPSTQSSDISAGQTLWHQASLTAPGPSGPTPIQARCADCHAQDGRDLKYFNYSNNSIRTRSMFHGLTAQQGDQIASYIRTLNVPNPGRPWNPPYQPGPGLDSQPVANWAAGAGLSAVLDQDIDMLNYLAPGGHTTNWAAASNVSAREIPVALQLPDWNSWLPGIHPLDAWGSAFTTSDMVKYYNTLRANLVPGDSTVYANNLGNYNFWSGAQAFIRTRAQASGVVWTARYTDMIYSSAQWLLVKNWELMQEFQLEGMATAVHGPQADPRAWVKGFAFGTSPNMLHIPSGAPGLHNGLPTTWTYFSEIWYHVQLILNSTDHMGSSRPIDWPYAYGMINTLSATDYPPQASLLLLWMVKGLQASQFDGGPELATSGWTPSNNNLGALADPNNQKLWPEYSGASRGTMTEAYLQQWFAKVRTFQPSQWYQGGWGTSTEVPVASYTGDFAGHVYFSLPRFRFLGVSSTLINQMAAWASTVWPKGNWTGAASATCAWQNQSSGDITCTSY